ncbi:MAG: hypothetical protein E6K76_11865 [Candidatus Eisenbacteria bacterium]|uniref:DUF3300 domain-containing protein n=1 Tax=Eiseniibacteriota bacterium TaxID=2212470 RepID=A0A538SZX6_UNCEI|nr:MAG: hypothetical protein E6K76_11865 [Candidatus Eisenbacteria bacterium]
MKRILLFVITGLLLVLFSAPEASAFGSKDVLKMHKDGIADSLIILKIENSGKTFHLGADDMHALQKAGLSDEVISTMLRTEGRDRGQDYYGHGDYYPYTYTYPYPHVFLGFGFHHYCTPYYGGYRFYRYRPHFAYPYSGNYGNYRYRGSYGSRQPSVGGSGTRYRRR